MLTTIQPSFTPMSYIAGQSSRRRQYRGEPLAHVVAESLHRHAALRLDHDLEDLAHRKLGDGVGTAGGEGLKRLVLFQLRLLFHERTDVLEAIDYLVQTGCSTQSAPSWSNSAMRSLGGTKSGLNGSVRRANKFEGRLLGQAVVPRDSACCSRAAQLRCGTEHEGREFTAMKVDDRPP
jgi:hypothetical protein